MTSWRIIAELKRDAFGTVELLSDGAVHVVRRVACGSGWPGSRWLAHRLARRERCALEALRGVPGVPRPLEDAAAASLPGCDGRPIRRRDVQLRSFLPGIPLYAAETLPADYFALLADLVRALHERGVCHNDLHKENNLLVGPDGRPSVLDFQLASVHRRRSRCFAVRCYDDLRHVDKHRLRYESRGGAPRSPSHRTPLATLWLWTGKRIYNFVKRGLLRRRGGEPRRSPRGPWPRWAPPVGARPTAPGR